MVKPMIAAAVALSLLPTSGRAQDIAVQTHSGQEVMECGNCTQAWTQAFQTAVQARQVAELSPIVCVNCDANGTQTIEVSEDGVAPLFLQPGHATAIRAPFAKLEAFSGNSDALNPTPLRGTNVLLLNPKKSDTTGLTLFLAGQGEDGRTRVYPLSVIVMEPSDGQTIALIKLVDRLYGSLAK